MSFGDPKLTTHEKQHECWKGNEREEVERIADNLSRLQSNIRGVESQIQRLPADGLTYTDVTFLRSVLRDSASLVAQTDESVKRWSGGEGFDTGESMRQKLLFSKLEASFRCEVEKFQKSMSIVDRLEYNLTQDTHHSLIDAESSSQSTSIDRSIISSPYDDFKLESNRVPLSLSSYQNGQDELTDLPFDPFFARQSRDHFIQNETERWAHSNELLTVQLTEKKLSTVHPMATNQDSSTDLLSFYPSTGTPGSSSPQSSRPDSSQEQHVSDPLVVHRHLIPSVLPFKKNYYDIVDDDDDNETLLPQTVSNIDTSATDIYDKQLLGSHSATFIKSPIQHNEHYPSVHEHDQLSPLDTFLQDEYTSNKSSKHINNQYLGHNEKKNQMVYDDEDDDEELSGLLSRQSIRSNSYLEGWQLTDSQRRHNDHIQLYITKERVQGVRRIKSQLTQAAQVFRELAHLINEQQDDLDLLDTSLINVKSTTGSAVDELRKANKLKQAARRRTLFMIGVTTIVGLIIFFVFCFQHSSPHPSSPSMTVLPHSAPSIPVTLPSSVHEGLLSVPPSDLVLPHHALSKLEEDLLLNNSEKKTAFARDTSFSTG